MKNTKHTAAATAAAMIAIFNEYLAAHTDTPFDTLVTTLESELRASLHLPAEG